LFRLRVVDAQGLRLQFNQIVIRNLLRFVDAFPVLYFVGGVTCLLNSKTQRLGDLAANTLVVHFPRVTEPDLDQLLAHKFNSLHQYPHLEARLRQRVTPAEAALVLQALMRRDDFEPQARVELFHSIALHFRAKVEFPAEALDGITDEQYIRNVADVLYRTRTGQKVEKIAA
ncbi:MAG: domain containing protein, partial [Pedosphaera sp.]|nr:domain containing protein [Pedosphaera sp.]